MSGAASGTSMNGVATRGAVMSRGVPRALTSALVLAALATGCSEPAPSETESRERRETPATGPTGSPAAGSHAAGSPSTEPLELEPAGADTAPSAPVRGCVFGEATAVHAGAWSALVGGPWGFVVAVSEHDGAREQVSVLRVRADGRAETIAQAALEHPVPPEHRRAGPALAASGERLALVLVDGQRRVLAAELARDASDAPLTWVSLGESASHRFAPAVSALESGWAAAWTSERDEAMRVHGALLTRGAVRAARELRAPGGGSAAPSFVAGASAPTLLFLDPRAGLSVIHRVTVSADGFGEPTIARPVNLVTEPPALAAARVGELDWAAYTAIGVGATTAIGLLRADGTTPPVALVPGTGYGVLHVAAAALPDARALFVADAPREPAPTAPRELHVRVVGADGAPSEPAIVRGPSGAARRGRVAHAGGGLVAVSFTDGEQVHVALGRCATR